MGSGGRECTMAMRWVVGASRWGASARGIRSVVVGLAAAAVVVDRGCGGCGGAHCPGGWRWWWWWWPWPGWLPATTARLQACQATTAAHSWRARAPDGPVERCASNKRTGERAQCGVFECSAIPRDVSALQFTVDCRHTSHREPSSKVQPHSHSPVSRPDRDLSPHLPPPPTRHHPPPDRPSARAQSPYQPQLR